MMLIIHGLAPTMKFADVKKLIKQQCKIQDFILDNLLSESDGTKKVRVGLADENEGLILMKYLDGYRMPGNFIVKVSPISNKPVPSGLQSGYGDTSVYPNQSRNDYPNQMNPNDYNAISHGPNTMRGPAGQQAPSGPQVYGGPPGPRGHHETGGHHRPGGPVWSSNTNSNQWGPNSNVTDQVPQNTFGNRAAHPQNAQPGYMPQHTGPRPEGRPFEQGRQGPPVEQNYGTYQPKNAPRQNLRSIDTIETTGPGGRFTANQFQQEKSMTIMKDNFQGPTPFNINHPAGNQPPHPHRGPNPSWEPPHQQSSEIPFAKSVEERKYPQGDQPMASKGFQPKPDTYKEYEKRRGFSPPRNPMARGISPGRRDERDPAGRREDLRRDPPGRREEMHRETGRMGDMGPRDIGPRRPSPSRMDPTQRRVSPPGNRPEPRGRRFSLERRVSPGDRRNIRRDSPPRRVSPSRRLVSPARRDGPRFSPGRHPSDKLGDKFRPENKDLKKVRPAYEPLSHAPKQAMYSSGFRPIAQDDKQYSGMRGEQPGPWHRHSDDPIKKHDDERRGHMGRERGPDQVDARYSPTRKSRSPIRRDRSPIRDRLRRNSLSPRSSYSPRRSWALEKRRSPDAPPPPLWPGQDADIDNGRPSRPNFPATEEKSKHQPVWERRSFKEDELRNRRPEEHNSYDAAKLRVAKELMERESAHAGPSDRYQPKFSPRRDDYGERRDNYHRELPDRKGHAGDLDVPRRPYNEDRRDDFNRREMEISEEQSHRASLIRSPEDFDKDFEDIYKRAVQFKKKAEELRKSSSRKRDDFDENRPRYDDHGRHCEEEPVRQQDVRRFDSAHRDDQYPRDMQNKERVNDAAQSAANRAIRQKREKAINEITHKILDKSEQYKHVEADQRRYIIEELKTVVGNKIFEIFGDSDVSFIEIIIKFQAKYNMKDEERILQDVMRSIPKHLRTMKRQAPDSMDVPPKINRISPSADLNQGRRSAALHMRPNQPTLVVKKKLMARPAQRAIGPKHGTRTVQRAIRPEPGVRPVQGAVGPYPRARPILRAVGPDPRARPVQRAVGTDPRARPVQRAVGPDPRARPVQRAVGPDPRARPVQRAVGSDPRARPVQRAVGPDPRERPVQRAVEPDTRARPVQRAMRPSPGVRPVQRAVGPETGARSVQRAVGSELDARPLQRMVEPESVTRPIKRDVRPESGNTPVMREARPVQRGVRPELETEPVRRAIRTDPVDKPVQRVVQNESLETQKSQTSNTALKRSANDALATDIKESPKRKKETPKSPEALQKHRTGDYELNSLVAKSLDAELDDVMDKVLLNLADFPNEDIENGAAEKLRSKVIPDLKNVLGLNVTKRLLNVYNPLNVKVKFNGKPEKEELREFLKKYNFIGFVREAVNVFAAQVKGIDDFDRLCKNEEVKCGSVKVTINPVYSFISCPPNLRTKYIEIISDGINIDTGILNDNKTETSKIIDKSTTNQGNDSTTTKDVNNKIGSKTNKVVVKLEQSKTEPPIVIKTENKVVSPIKAQNKASAPQHQTKIAAKVTTPKTEMATVKVENKETPTKTTESKVTLQKPTVPVTPKTESKITPTKPMAKIIPEAEPNVAPTKTVAKVVPKTESNVAPTKPIAILTPKTESSVTPAKLIAKVNPKEESKVTPTKPIAKVTPKTESNVTPTNTKAKVTPKEESVTPAKPQAKKVQAKVTPNKLTSTVAQKKPIKPTKKSFEVEDDYDELDDHDILALMSEGIVLDEYVGSDEE